MAFKFVLLSAILAIASAGVLQTVPYSHVANTAVDAFASSHQNVVRTFDGTVSQYSKTIETPYSSVHKHDTRVSHQPVVAKTVTYAAPAPAPAPAPVPTAIYTHSAPVLQKTITYAHSTPVAKTVAYVAPAVSKASVPAVYTHAKPVSKIVYAQAQPAVTKTMTYAAPAPVPAPAPVYQHEVPVATNHVTYTSSAPVYHQHHATPVAATTSYNHGPAATTYTHNAPGVSAYGASQTVHYSPADISSHMSFDGFGTHWGW